MIEFLTEFGRQFDCSGHRVCGLDRRDDALQPAQQSEGLHGLGVGDRPVLGAAEVLEEGVLGSDARVQSNPAEMEWGYPPVWPSRSCNR